MLYSSIGRSRPSPRYLRPLRWAALAAFALCLPGLASAASVTFDVLAPSGFGATVTLADGEVPGTLNIDIESVGPAGDGSDIGDILAIYLFGSAPALDDIDASGADVDVVTTSAGPGYDDILVDIGAGGLWALNGIGTTSFVYTNTAGDLSVEALGGANLGVWIGFDSSREIPDPDFEIDGSLKVIKPTGEIPVVPEPGTSALMLLGLIGLAATSRRLETAIDA